MLGIYLETTQGVKGFDDRAIPAIRQPFKKLWLKITAGNAVAAGQVHENYGLALRYII
jgi:hypothetical protein